MQSISLISNALCFVYQKKIVSVRKIVYICTIKFKHKLWYKKQY